MVIVHCGGFDFFKKNFKIFLWVRVRARYKPSRVFRLSLVLIDYPTSARGIMDLGCPEGLFGRQRAVDRYVEARGRPKRPEGRPKSIITRAEVE